MQEDEGELDFLGLAEHGHTDPTQEQLAPYAQLFRGMGPVLDLGCGRGEFLELLKEEGVAGYGVDSDRLACDEARKKALKAVNADVIEPLSLISRWAAFFRRASSST